MVRIMGLEANLDTAVANAVRAAGSQSALARLLGCNQSTVYLWLRHRKLLPAEHVLTVEAATGISRHELRPDLYRLEDATPAPRDVSADMEPAR